MDTHPNPRGATPRTPATDGRLRVPGRGGASPGGASGAHWRLAASPGVSLLAMLASPAHASARADALQSPGFKVRAVPCPGGRRARRTGRAVHAVLGLGRANEVSVPF